MEEEKQAFHKLDRVKVVEKKNKHNGECGVVSHYEMKGDNLIYSVWLPQSKCVEVYEEESLEKL